MKVLDRHDNDFVRAYRRENGHLALVYALRWKKNSITPICASGDPEKAERLCRVELRSFVDNRRVWIVFNTLDDTSIENTIIPQYWLHLHLRSLITPRASAWLCIGLHPYPDPLLSMPDGPFVSRIWRFDAVHDRRLFYHFPDYDVLTAFNRRIHRESSYDIPLKDLAQFCRNGDPPKHEHTFEWEYGNTYEIGDLFFPWPVSTSPGLYLSTRGGPELIEERSDPAPGKLWFGESLEQNFDYLNPEAPIGWPEDTLLTCHFSRELDLIPGVTHTTSCLGRIVPLIDTPDLISAANPSGLKYKTTLHQAAYVLPIRDPRAKLDSHEDFESAEQRQIRLRISRLPWLSGLHVWNRCIAEPIVDGLMTVRAGSPISLTPWLVVDPLVASLPGEPIDSPWLAEWVVTDTAWFSSSTSLQSEYPNVLLRRFGETEPIKGSALHLEDLHLYLDAGGTPPRSAIVRFNGFKTIANLPLSVNGELAIGVSTAGTEIEGKLIDFWTIVKVDGWSFVPFVTSFSDLSQWVAAGALDLAFGEDTNVGQKENFGLLMRVQLDKVRARNPIPVFRLTGELRLVHLRPGGQDDLPSDQFASKNVESLQDLHDNDKDEAAASNQVKAAFRRERAIVIPLFLASSGTNSSRILKINEVYESDRSQSLGMTIVGPPPTGSDSLELVVLDRHPLLVARVSAPRLYPPLDAQNRLATWSAEADHGASWEIAGVEPGVGVRLILPPQAVGEEMEKSVNDPLGATDLVAFRFSPTADLTVYPSYYEQRFVEAPWNLRRVLGYPRQRAPGARLISMRFELLYGLHGALSLGDDISVRVGELTARLGALQERMSVHLAWKGSKGHVARYRRRRVNWANTYAAYLSRLSILEPSRTDGRVPIVFSDGLSYELRRCADNAPNSSPLPPASRRWPILDKPEPPATDPEFGGWISTNGLAGGATWPFDFDVDFASLLRTPRTIPHGAVLARPFFSALGGWGDQKAVFDNGNLTLSSTTDMGRVSYVAKERVGRISVLWHRAKHVVIYERTVAPSRQFFLSQDAHLGRAVVRKVAEYVEISTPHRAYPDSDALAVTSACMTGCRFLSERIAVNSAWGGTIKEGNGGNEGYYIPLWNRAAAATLPDVYPKPQVQFEFSSDPNPYSPAECCEVDDPEKLVFWAETSGRFDDRTDLWPSVREIDYCDVPLDLPADHESGLNPGSPDAQLPDGPLMGPGLTQFTYEVIPHGGGVNVVAERSDEALTAVLRNVTLMRAGSVSAPVGIVKDIATAISNIHRVNQFGEGVLSALRARLPISDAIEADELAALISDARGIIEKFKNELKVDERVNGLKDLADSLQIGAASICQRITDEATRVLSEWISALQQKPIEFINGLQGALATLTGVSADVTSKARAFADSYFAIFKAQVGIPGIAVLGLEQKICAAVDVLYQTARQCLSQIELVRNKVNQVAELGGISLEEKRRLLLDGIDDLQRLMLSRVDELLRQCEKQLAGELGQRLVRVTISGVALKGARAWCADVASVIVEKCAFMRQSVTSWTNPFMVLLDTLAELDAAIDVTKTGSQLAQMRDELTRDIQGILGPLRTASEAYSGFVLQISQNIQTAIGNAQHNADEIRRLVNLELQNLAGNVNTAAGAFESSVNAEIKNICNHALFFLDLGNSELAQKTKALLDDIETALNGADLAEIRRAIRQTALQELSELNQYCDHFAREFRSKAGGAIARVGDPVFRLVRAFGDAPAVPNMPFNRQRIAYFFDELKDYVTTTPVAALVNRGGNALKSFGARIPTRELADRLIPDQLKNFDLKDIFPDMAGLRLAKFFPGIKFPDGMERLVKITHGADPQTLRAWLKAAINVPLSGPAELFSFGPVTIRVRGAKFSANASLEATPQGVRRQVEGKITADWDIYIAGFRLLTFRETTLAFDDSGRMDFDLNPSKVNMPGVLKFLADLLGKAGSKSGGQNGSGLTIRALEVDGAIAGVEAVLALGLPSVQFGAFGMSGLALGASFGISAIPEFAIRSTFNIARRENPFALTIFILGGGGWLDVRSEYLPFKDQVATALSIGIFAQASLGIAFGPIKGSVYIRFGINVEFRAGTGGPKSGLAIAIFLELGGSVKVLWISVSINLRLELTYNDGTLVGRGTLSIKIKICWCFSIRIQTSIQYSFAKSGNNRNLFKFASFRFDSQYYTKAAENYLAAFE